MVIINKKIKSFLNNNSFKKITAMFVIAVIFFFAIPISFSSAKSETSGNWLDYAVISSSTTFKDLDGDGYSEISTPEQLAVFCKFISSYKNDKIELTNDLDMGAHFWTPIACFGGIFNGNMHKIKNLKIKYNANGSLSSQYSANNYKCAGLFSMVGNKALVSGEVKNIQFENCKRMFANELCWHCCRNKLWHNF